MGELPRASNESNRQTVNVDGLEVDIYRLIPFIEGMETESINIESLIEFDRKAKYFNGLSPQEIIEEYQRTPNFDEIIENHPDWRIEVERVRDANYAEHPI